jgi:hypothetical protein
LLHDANGVIWSTPELTGYINEGRNQVALDTACLRMLDTVTFLTGQETYAWSTLITQPGIDLLNVIVLCGQTRIPLIYRPWSVFNAYFRTWQSNASRPAAWSNFGPGAAAVIYIQPVPDQNYTAYLDYHYTPQPLVDNTTVDQLVYPYTTAVPYYAAFKAKFKTQSYGEAEAYNQQYRTKAAWCISTAYTRRMPDIYNGTGVG